MTARQRVDWDALTDALAAALGYAAGDPNWIAWFSGASGCGQATWVIEHRRLANWDQIEVAGILPWVGLLAMDPEYEGSAPDRCDRYAADYLVIARYAAPASAATDYQVIARRCQQLAERLRYAILATNLYGDLFTVERYGMDLPRGPSASVAVVSAYAAARFGLVRRATYGS